MFPYSTVLEHNSDPREWMQIPYLPYSVVVWISEIMSVRVLHHRVGKIYIQVQDDWFLCFFPQRIYISKQFFKKEENRESINLEHTKVWEAGGKGEHAVNSSTAQSESKQQALELRALALKPPWQAGSPAKESRVQRKRSKSGLRPSIDHLTF